MNGVLVTESDFRHPRVLRQTFVTVGGLGWQISSVKLVKTEEEAGTSAEVIASLRDEAYGIPEQYEVMIFKAVNGARNGSKDYGHYRSDNKDEVLLSHENIVNAISSGTLEPSVTPNEEFSKRVSIHVEKIISELHLEGNVK